MAAQGAAFWRLVSDTIQRGRCSKIRPERSVWRFRSENTKEKIRKRHMKAGVDNIKETA